MDKDKQRQSVYPNATRGVLANEQVHKKYRSKPLNKVRDYSPSSLIMQAVVICVLIGAAGIGAYIFYYAKLRSMNPDTAAFTIAKRFSELRTSQSYDQLENDIGNTLKLCKAPVLTITHDYTQPGQTRRTDTTVINTEGIKNITPILDDLVQKSDGARLNTMSVDCPTS